MINQKKLSQYFTLPWAAELLFDKYYQGIGPNSFIWEPTCGTGNMLAGIPAEIKCIGTELDPDKASLAMQRTGRQVIVGNALTVSIDQPITHVFGNPPFVYSFFEKLMARVAGMLKQPDQFAGLIIPAYFLQTSRTVMQIHKAQQWSIKHTMLPRDLFPGLIYPLVFARFIKEHQPRLYNMFLYEQMAGFKTLSTQAQFAFTVSVSGPRSIWQNAVNTILTELGGEADLKQIYQKMESAKPSNTAWWREKTRQTLARYFTRTGEGVYSNKTLN